MFTPASIHLDPVGPTQPLLNGTNGGNNTKVDIFYYKLSHCIIERGSILIRNFILYAMK